MSIRSKSSHLVASGVWTCFSCSIVADADRSQCDVASDCGARGFEDAYCDEGRCVALEMFDEADWECLTDFQSIVPPAGRLVPYRLRFEGINQPGQPPAGLSIRLCGSVDWQCDDPIADVPQPDETGSVTLELDPAFRGYLEVDGTELKPALAFLPSLWTWPPPPIVFRLATVTDIEALVDASRVPRDSSVGFATLSSYDCSGGLAAGVSMGLADEGEQSLLPYYFRGGVPDFHASRTDDQGTGGWALVPVGQVTAEARRADTGRFIGVAGFYSWPDHVSYVPIGPSHPL